MDYNWLLTTIAQSSAALVGISSGFLILRISKLIDKRKYDIDNIKGYHKEFEKYSYAYERGGAAGSGQLHKSVVELKQKWDDSHKRLKEFPYRIFIGIFGIFWLIGFSIIYPVSLIPQVNSSQSYFNNHYTWCFFKTTYFLKWTFGIGIGWLVLYLVIEVIKYMKYKKPEIELNNDMKSIIRHCEYSYKKIQEQRNKKVKKENK